MDYESFLEYMDYIDGQEQPSEPLPPYRMYERDTSPTPPKYVKPPKYRSRRSQRRNEKLSEIKNAVCETFLTLFSTNTVVDKSWDRYESRPRLYGLYLANIM